MSDLRELVAKWRTEACDMRYTTNEPGPHDEARAEELEGCADELEAALSAVASPPALEGVDAVAWIIDNGDGTVTCPALGLMFSKNTLCDKEVDHATAERLAAEWGGRLPTLQELFAIADHGRCNPAIDTEFFPDTKSDWYWTSTELKAVSSFAWVVDFYDGYADYCHRSDDGAFVRAVRPVPAGQ